MNVLKLYYWEFRCTNKEGKRETLNFTIITRDEDRVRKWFNESKKGYKLRSLKLVGSENF